MHLCYIDDSGDSDHGVILTALIIEDVRWSEVLDAWLEGRRQIHREFHVPKLKELHANTLYKGRGSYCETADQNARFGDTQRAAVGRVMLSHLAKAPVTVMSVGASDRSAAVVYAKFVALLEDWAVDNHTFLLLFYDGQQGLIDDPQSPERQRDAWEQAIRAASPYRDVHRGLDLATRRVVEDVIMQDSRYSQFIQAADLLAYGAYHKHRQENPDLWQAKSHSAAAVRAYMRMSAKWPADSDYGVYWLG